MKRSNRLVLSKSKFKLRNIKKIGISDLDKIRYAFGGIDEN